MFLLWHPSLTAINLSYTFPILETSATALCGTTGSSQVSLNVFKGLTAQCISNVAGHGDVWKSWTGVQGETLSYQVLYQIHWFEEILQLFAVFIGFGLCCQQAYLFEYAQQWWFSLHEKEEVDCKSKEDTAVMFHVYYSQSFSTRLIRYWIVRTISNLYHMHGQSQSLRIDNALFCTNSSPSFPRNSSRTQDSYHYVSLGKQKTIISLKN